MLGAQKVARLLVATFATFREHGVTVERVHVGGQPALRMSRPGEQTVAVWSLAIIGGQVAAVHGVVNPDKLAHLQPDRPPRP